MKITELLEESQQLDEGPFTQAVGKVGGKVAKGIANIGKDLKTGFKAGYSGEEPAEEPAAATTPAATSAAPTQAAPVKKAAPTQAAPAQAAPTAPAAVTEPAADANPKPATDNSGPDIAAMKKELDTLLKNYEDDLAMQNKNWNFVMPKVNALEKQVADLVAAGSAAPVAEPAVTPAAEPEAKRRGGRVAGELSQSPSAVRRREQRAANKKPTQAEIDADREAKMGPTSDSIIRTGNSLSETLARKVQEQKQRMFETALVSGTQSIFKK